MACQPDAKLEKRVAALEKRTDDLSGQVTNIFNGLDKIASSVERMGENTTRMVSDLAETNAVWTREITFRLDTYLATMTNHPRAIMRTDPQPIVQPRNGVPAGVYNQILLDARKKWPGEYDMQQYEVKKQVEAFRRLNP